MYCIWTGKKFNRYIFRLDKKIQDDLFDKNGHGTCTFYNQVYKISLNFN